ncbi:MAG: exonuclease VII small subunit [Candidatus Pelagibacter sp. TMED273]|nr:MAG: exonuclease VII small subunit [Candidatus Pelagibacter sp. TMED273]|tara:strand:- start:3843 stop:4097 length:255 start_codon:yes stop_codon:yes gene_type:complete
MKEKNLPDDIKDKSLNELTKLANSIIESLEKEKDLENSISKYKNLIKLNNLIEKKFRNTSKEISNITREKIQKILKKNNEKRIK